MCMYVGTGMCMYVPVCVYVGTGICAGTGMCVYVGRYRYACVYVYVCR